MADHRIMFVATASTYVDIRDTGQSRDAAVEEAYSEVHVSLCHQCARHVDLGDFEAEDDSRDYDAELAALQAERDRLREFVADIGANGLRCDLTPTTNFGVSTDEMYTNLTDYLRRADTAIRDRARALLPAKEA